MTASALHGISAMRRSTEARLLLVFLLLVLGMALGGCAANTRARADLGLRPHGPRPHPHAIWVRGHWTSLNGHYHWVNGYWQK